MRAILWCGLAFLAGCVDPIVYVVEPFQDKTTQDEQLMRKLSTLYPQEMKLKHRIIVTARGKQYDMTGYLLYRQPDHFYAAAYVEAGGPVFEMVHSHGKGRVLRKPKHMPELYLENGIMQDLLHIYSNKNPIAGQVVARDSESTRFVFPRGNNFYQEFLVNKLGTLFSSRTGHKGELKRTVRYSNHREVDGKMLAEVIYLENYDVRYEMNIKLLEAGTTLPKNFDEKIRLAL